MHDLLDLENLNRRRKKHIMSFVYKILHDMAPEYMQANCVSKYSNYDLRRTDVLALPKPTTNNGKRTFSYRGATLYNNIPLSDKQSLSKTLTERSVISHLIFFSMLPDLSFNFF